jgi:hypothetical protein
MRYVSGTDLRQMITAAPGRRNGGCRSCSPARRIAGCWNTTAYRCPGSADERDLRAASACRPGRVSGALQHGPAPCPRTAPPLSRPAPSHLNRSTSPTTGYAGNKSCGGSPTSTTSPPYKPTLLRKTQVTHPNRISEPHKLGGMTQKHPPGHSHHDQNLLRKAPARPAGAQLSEVTAHYLR